PGQPDGARGTVPDAGALRLPAEGESSCGDAWALEVAPEDGTVSAAVADGLGHGPAAAEAAEIAAEVFRRSPGLPLPRLMRALHEALRSTRGAAVGLLRRTPDGAVEHCAVGNVRAYVVGHDGVLHRFGAQPGVVGWNMPDPVVRRLPDARGGTLLLHSDGVDGGWERSPAPELTRLPAPLLPVVLAHGHRTVRDDVAVLAVAPVPRAR
ncbi:SpoIIE family protein phosphatase, partial [Streptomyces somaliensis]|uniref:SpoIIE family protein phosphatase n=1 Tax=Streptomyces somaliensis TaxID=78355 RepID=UPI00263A7184